MTETTTFPFSSLHDQSAEGEEPRRPLAAILGGGLLAVALVGGAVFAFTGGDDELPVPAAVTSAAAGSQAAPPVEAALTQTVPAANTESIARNPFEPKYVEPAPVAPPSPDPAPSAVPTDVPPAAQDTAPITAPITVPDTAPTLVVVDAPSRAVVPAPTGSAAPTSPAPAPPAPAPAPREYRLVLTGVTTDGGVPTAAFTIDGAVSTVKPTEIFGPQRQLLLRSVQQRPEDGRWTATIQVGDARPIDVVVGEAVYVQ